MGGYPGEADLRADRTAGNDNDVAVRRWFQAASNGSFPSAAGATEWVVTRLHNMSCAVLRLVITALESATLDVSESGPPCLSRDECATAVR